MEISHIRRLCSNLVGFGTANGNIRFSQAKDRQKYKNVQREPRLALAIVDPANPYRYPEIRGVVKRIAEDPDRVAADWSCQAPR